MARPTRKGHDPVVPSPAVQKEPPVVLITGCSSGIGRASAEALRDRGALVVATARDPQDIEDLADPGRVECLPLDVTDEASIQDAVQTVLDRHGRIDALVNNAGYGVMLPLEEMPLEAMRQQYEVNVFGMHRLTQQVLPVMRGQQSGRIVNVSSAAGYVSLPMMGAYSGTKFAVRAMTYALRNEVASFGITTHLIEPGRIATRFGQRSDDERQRWLGDRAGKSPYQHLLGRWDDVTFNEQGKDVSIIADRIVHACTSKRPRLHYRAPLDAKGAGLAARFVPTGALLAGVRWYFRR